MKHNFAKCLTLLMVGGLVLALLTACASENESLSYSLLSDGTYEIVGADLTQHQGTFVIASSSDITVTSIGAEAFKGCAALTDVVISESVKNIGSYAFAWCGALKEVTISNGVTNIGDYAFFQCTTLEQVTLGNRLTSIGASAFFGCSRLTTLTIPHSVTSIGNFAFCDCGELTIRYEGSEEEWNTLVKENFGEFWDYQCSVTMIFAGGN